MATHEHPGTTTWQGEGAAHVVKTTSTVSFTDRSLEPFKAYWYCVSAIGFAGQGEYCAPLMGRAA